MKKEESALLHTLRLENPYPAETAEHLIWNDQCRLNVPMLIQASLALHAFCQAQKKTKILFTSRDCCLWIQIFKTLFPQYDSIYYFSSRYTYLYPTLAFIEYVKSVYTDESIIVDSNGTGRSCQIFFQKHIGKEPLYFSIVNSGQENHCIMRKADPHEGIERMNYDLAGPLYDVQNGEPKRSSIEYNLQYVRPSHACIAKCVELLPFYKIDSFNLQILDWAATSMESPLEIDKHIQHAKVHAHLKNDPGRCIHVLYTGHLFETF